jgi:hypothetical protein
MAQDRFQIVFDGRADILAEDPSLLETMAAVEDHTAALDELRDLREAVDDVIAPAPTSFTTS